MSKYLCVLPSHGLEQYARQAADKLGLGGDSEFITIYGINRPLDRVAAELDKGDVEAVISRGSLAQQIVETFSSLPPMIYIRLGFAETSDLIQKAIALSGLEMPRLLFGCRPDLLPDYQSYCRIFNVSIFFMSMDTYQSPRTSAETDTDIEKFFLGHQEEFDVIIGGPISCGIAQKLGLKCILMGGSEDSIFEAFRVAQQVVLATHQQRQANAELSILLDHSVNGIVKLDRTGVILNLNLAAAQILESTAPQLLRKPIQQFLQGFSDDLLGQVFIEEKALYSLFFRIGKNEILSSLVPIIAENEVDSAILSIQTVKSVVSVTPDARRQLDLRGYFAKTRFSDLPLLSTPFINLLHSAKIYAHTDTPVTICGPVGTEQVELAECIHQESARRDGPFVTVNCMSLNPLQQQALFTGNQLRQAGSEVDGNLFLIANHGTLLLQNVEALTLFSQQLLCGFLSSGRIYSSEGEQLILTSDVRLIFTCRHFSYHLVESGRMLTELYYALSTLTLDIPPLSSRPEDVGFYLDKYMEESCARHARYITLTAETRKFLCRYPWTGNLLQLKSFCEHLVITAGRSSVNRHTAELHLQQMYGEKEPPLSQSGNELPGEAAQIALLLEKHGGNRQKVAEELQISRSTLWRLMKKYGIQGRYLSDEEEPEG